MYGVLGFTPTYLYLIISGNSGINQITDEQNENNATNK